MCLENRFVTRRWIGLAQGQPASSSSFTGDEARAPIIYEGTTQIHKLMQAEHALGYRRLNGQDGEVSPIAAWAPALAQVR
jgi:hypothetical protein